MKICKKCKLERDLKEYYLNKEGKPRSSTCIECSKIEFREYYQNNKERKLKYQLEYSKENKEKIKLKDKKYREEKRETINERKKINYQINKEEIKKKSRKYYDENKEKINNKRRGRANSTKYYHKNKESILPKIYKYRSNRLKEDKLYRLTHTIRTLIRNAFRRAFTSKSKKTSEILGCTYEEFKMYLESKFDENMNWENQGTYWHLDHIIPISSAQTEEEVYKLNHYTNFQPLYWLDNLKKSNRI